MVDVKNNNLHDKFGKIEISSNATSSTKNRTLVIEGTGVKIVLKKGYDREYLRNALEVLCL